MDYAATLMRFAFVENNNHFLAIRSCRMFSGFAGINICEIEQVHVFDSITLISCYFYTAKLSIQIFIGNKKNHTNTEC